MEKIIDKAIYDDMKANTIEGLQFLNHVIEQMVELEELLK